MKNTIKGFAACLLIVAAILSMFYVGVSRELCRRDNLTPADYADMKLDCSFWLYR